MARHRSPAILAATSPMVLLWVLLVLLQTISVKAELTSLLFGAGWVSANNNILIYDPAIDLASVFAPTGITSSLNGLALDRNTEILYYVAEGSVANPQERAIYYMHTRYNSTGRIAPLTDIGVVELTTKAIPQNACWYKQSYWFIVTETLTLRRVFFTSSGGIPTGVASYTNYPIAAAPTQAPLMRFGGIDIEPTANILYGTTVRGQFFTINLNNLAAPLPFTLIVPADVLDRPSLQITFNVDYSILYGQYQVDGTWYTINKDTGALTQLLFTISSDLTNVDLSGALPFLGTRNPTSAPTTQRPTPAPTYNPSPSYNLVGDGIRCTPDVVVTTLYAPTAESCYQACLRRFDPETTFVFNVFPQDPPDPALTCSCCRQCLVTIPTPGGQVFSTTCDPPLKLVSAPKKQIRAKAGEIIKLKYKVTNKNKFALGNGGFQLQLPDDVIVVQVTSPDGVEQGMSSQAITWWPLYFDKGESMSFGVQLRIRSGTSKALVPNRNLTGLIFVRPLAEGIPTCAGPSSTVSVSLLSKY